jgi:hypothetical protein
MSWLLSPLFKILLNNNEQKLHTEHKVYELVMISIFHSWDAKENMPSETLPEYGLNQCIATFVLWNTKGFLVYTLWQI